MIEIRFYLYKEQALNALERKPPPYTTTVLSQLAFEKCEKLSIGCKTFNTVLDKCTAISTPLQAAHEV